MYAQVFNKNYVQAVPPQGLPTVGFLQVFKRGFIESARLRVPSGSWAA